MTKKKRRMLFGASLVIVFLGWVFFNPPGYFGFCTFGLTTYGSVPRLAADIQVRCDGATRSVEKTHALKLEHVRWLLEPMPSILIISVGWDGAVHPLDELKDFKECEVQFFKTGEAIEKYNRLKSEGQSVAIHIHSTC